MGKKKVLRLFYPFFRKFSCSVSKCGCSVIEGLHYVPSLGIISILLSLIFSAQAEGITLTDHLHWTWHSLTKSLFTPRHVTAALLVGSLIGLGIGLHYGLSDALSYGVSGELSYELSYELSSGLSEGLSFGLLYWLTTAALLLEERGAREVGTLLF